MRRSAWPYSALAAACASLALSSGPCAAEDDGLAARGRTLLEDKCARCHAIGLADTSAHPEAPPFRIVLDRYPAEALEESLAEGIVSGHPDMPEIAFDPDEIAAIIAHLKSLSSATR